MFFITEYIGKKALDNPANGNLILPATFSVVKMH